MGAEHRLDPETPLDSEELPKRLTFCGHCFRFVVPSAPDRYPLSEIPKHIRQEHPQRGGLTVQTLVTTEDAILIREVVTEQSRPLVFICGRGDEETLLRSRHELARHWLDNHCARASVEEIAPALEAGDERCTEALYELLDDAYTAASAGDDGYVIHHQPSAPRIRGRDARYTVFLDGPVTWEQDELAEYLLAEGLDEDSGNSGGFGAACCFELRVCHLMDGFIPIVRGIQAILPAPTENKWIKIVFPLAGPGAIPCKVNWLKRAVYNVEGKLRTALVSAGIDAGVRMYLTRVGDAEYVLEPRHSPHVVRNCKRYVSGHYELFDAHVAWESSDALFRHHLTLQDLDGLHAEAHTINRSIRELVFDVMGAIAREEAVRVTEVWDAVFRRRACSLGAV